MSDRFVLGIDEDMDPRVLKLGQTEDDVSFYHPFINKLASMKEAASVVAALNAYEEEE